MFDYNNVELIHRFTVTNRYRQLKGYRDQMVMEITDEPSIDELLDYFRRYALACGFSPDWVKRIVLLEENQEVVYKEDLDDDVLDLGPENGPDLGPDEGSDHDADEPL